MSQLIKALVDDMIEVKHMEDDNEWYFSQDRFPPTNPKEMLSDFIMILIIAQNFMVNNMPIVSRITHPNNLPNLSEFQFIWKWCYAKPSPKILNFLSKSNIYPIHT